MSPEAQNFDNDNEKKNLKNKPDSKQELGKKSTEEQKKVESIDKKQIDEQKKSAEQLGESARNLMGKNSIETKEIDDAKIALEKNIEAAGDNKESLQKAFETFQEAIEKVTGTTYKSYSEQGEKLNSELKKTKEDYEKNLTGFKENLKKLFEDPSKPKPLVTASSMLAKIHTLESVNDKKPIPIEEGGKNPADILMPKGVKESK